MTGYSLYSDPTLSLRYAQEIYGTEIYKCTSIFENEGLCDRLQSIESIDIISQIHSGNILDRLLEAYTYSRKIRDFVTG